MGLQPSASKTGLLLACQRPFDPDLVVEEDEADEPALYGSAFHLVLAELLAGRLPHDKGPRYARTVDNAVRTWRVRHVADELAAHVRSSFRFLTSWLTRNGWDIKRAKIETSYAISVKTGAARQIEAPTAEGHRYAAASDEIGATADLECPSIDDRRFLTLDHKTGYLTEDHYSGDTFDQPERLPQLKTLGLIGGSARYTTRELAIFHADRLGMPAVMSGKYTPTAANRHRRALAAAFARIGDGSLRPGAVCNVCPAAATCPARAADILGAASRAVMAAGLERLTTANSNWSDLPAAIRGGQLYNLIQTLEKLLPAARSEIRALVKAGEIIELNDGSVLQLSIESHETLSKSTIERALGTLAARRLIAWLRKKGVVEQGTRERLIPRRQWRR